MSNLGIDLVVWPAAILLLAAFGLAAVWLDRRERPLTARDAATVRLWRSMNAGRHRRVSAGVSAPGGLGADSFSSPPPPAPDVPRPGDLDETPGERSVAGPGHPACGVNSGAGNFTCDLSPGHGGNHADITRGGTVSWAGDRCSDPPEVSCSDSGCPVHGDEYDYDSACGKTDILDDLISLLDVPGPPEYQEGSASERARVRGSAYERDGRMPDGDRGRVGEVAQARRERPVEFLRDPAAGGQDGTARAGTGLDVSRPVDDGPLPRETHPPAAGDAVARVAVGPGHYIVGRILGPRPARFVTAGIMREACETAALLALADTILAGTHA